MLADDIRIVLFDAVGTVLAPQPSIAQTYVDTVSYTHLTLPTNREV